MTKETVAGWVKANTSNLQLRDYQLEAWLSLWQARTDDHRNRALVHLATGLGKTSVAAVDVLRYLKEENQSGRVLFVSHMNDISRQAKHTFERVNPDFTTAFFKNHKLKDVQVTFATFQSLYQSLDDIDPRRFDYIIWDEAHHIEADTFKTVRLHFLPKFQLGLTATPERSDGRDILKYFGEAIYHKSLAEGISEGWLSAVDYHIVFDQAIKEAMKKGFEAKSIREIRDLFGIKARNTVISEEVMQRRHNIGLDEAKTIVFCQNIPAAEEMAKLLGGEVYHSEIKSEERTDIFRRFKSGELQVICTVDMFNEGIDIPDARLIVFLRSTSSRTIFEQQLGRGLRRHPGKDKVTVLDFVANVERINFVRNLGHTISANRGPRGEYAVGGSVYINNSADNVPGYFATSSFEFEYQTIEILDKYNQLKDRETLNTVDVVEKYKELGNASAVGRHFGVSANAITKHLKRAGVDTSGHFKNGVSDLEVFEAYKKYGSSLRAGKVLGMSGGTVIDRLRRGGYGEYIQDQRRVKFTVEEMIQAYNEEGSLRAAAEKLGTTHWTLSNYLRKGGYIKKPKSSLPFTEKQLAYAYDTYKGDIVSIVDELNVGWAKVYQGLDSYGYIENYDGKMTSARAAAAWHKYGTSVRAAQVLGVSSTYVTRLSKNALYIRKYKKKEVKDEGTVSLSRKISEEFA